MGQEAPTEAWNVRVHVLVSGPYGPIAQFCGFDLRVPHQFTSGPIRRHIAPANFLVSHSVCFGPEPENAPAYVPGQILIQERDGVTQGEINKALGRPTPNSSRS